MTQANRVTVVAVLAIVSVGSCAREFKRLPSGGAPIVIAPAFILVAPGEKVSFSATGGDSRFVFAFATGGQQSGADALIDATGHYTAGSTGGAQDLIVVQDGSGDNATAQVTVGPPLQLAVDTTAVAPYQRVVLVAAGGKPPYAFSLTSDGSGGSIDPLTGLYLVGGTGSTSDVAQVVDANAQSRTLTFDVGTRLSAASPVGHSETPLQITPSGGKLPYVFRFADRGNHSHGVIDAATGMYVPGLNALTTDHLEVQDATGQVFGLSVPIAPWTVEVGSIYDGALHCGVADFNGDGHPEFYETNIFASQAGNFTTLSFGASALPRVQRLNLATPDGNSLKDLTVEDLDADGYDDVIVLSQRTVAMFHGDAAGSLILEQVVVPQSESAKCRFSGPLVATHQRQTLFFTGTPKAPSGSTGSCGGQPDAALLAATAPSYAVTVIATGPTGPTSTLPIPFARVETFDANDKLNDEALVLLAADGGTLEIREVQSPANIALSVALPMPSIIPILAPLTRAPVAGAAPADSSPVALVTGPQYFQTGLVLCDVTRVSDLVFGAFASACTLHAPPQPELSPFESVSLAPINVAGVGVHGASDTFFAALWNGNDGSIGLFENGAFLPVSPPPIPKAPFRVDCAAALDIDADQVNDLVVVSQTSTSAVIYNGEGDGTFGRRPRYHGESGGFFLADLDGDGNDDVINAGANGTLSISLADGHEFGFTSAISIGTAAQAIIADKFFDARAASLLVQYMGGIVFFQVDGKGLSSAPLATNLVAAPPYALFLSGDFGGAALGPDVIGVDATSNDALLLTVLRHDAAATLTPVSLPILPQFYDGLAVAVVDLDGNGAPDAVAGSVTDLGATTQYLTCFQRNEWNGGPGAWQAIGACIPNNIDAAGFARHNLVRPVGHTQAQAVFLGPGPVADDTVFVVSATGVTATPLPFVVRNTRARLGNVAGDAALELMVMEEGSGRIHFYGGPNFDQEVQTASGLFAPGGLLGAAARGAALGDLLVVTNDAFIPLIPDDAGVYR